MEHSFNEGIYVSQFFFHPIYSLYQPFKYAEYAFWLQQTMEQDLDSTCTKSGGAAVKHGKLKG